MTMMCRYTISFHAIISYCKNAEFRWCHHDEFCLFIREIFMANKREDKRKLFLHLHFKIDFFRKHTLNPIELTRKLENHKKKIQIKYKHSNNIQNIIR